MDYNYYYNCYSLTPLEPDNTETRVVVQATVLRVDPVSFRYLLTLDWVAPVRV